MVEVGARETVETKVKAKIFIILFSNFFDAYTFPLYESKVSQ